MQRYHYVWSVGLALSLGGCAGTSPGLVSGPAAGSRASGGVFAWRGRPPASSAVEATAPAGSRSESTAATPATPPPRAEKGAAPVGGGLLGRAGRRLGGLGRKSGEAQARAELVRPAGNDAWADWARMNAMAKAQAARSREASGRSDTPALARGRGTSGETGDSVLPVALEIGPESATARPRPRLDAPAGRPRPRPRAVAPGVVGPEPEQGPAPGPGSEPEAAPLPVTLPDAVEANADGGVRRTSGDVPADMPAEPETAAAVQPLAPDPPASPSAPPPRTAPPPRPTAEPETGPKPATPADTTPPAPANPAPGTDPAAPKPAPAEPESESPVPAPAASAEEPAPAAAAVANAPPAAQEEPTQVAAAPSPQGPARATPAAAAPRAPGKALPAPATKVTPSAAVAAAPAPAAARMPVPPSKSLPVVVAPSPQNGTGTAPRVKHRKKLSVLARLGLRHHPADAPRAGPAAPPRPPAAAAQAATTAQAGPGGYAAPAPLFPTAYYTAPVAERTGPTSAVAAAGRKTDSSVHAAAAAAAAARPVPAPAAAVVGQWAALEPKAGGAAGLGSYRGGRVSVFSRFAAWARGDEVEVDRHPLHCDCGDHPRGTAGGATPTAVRFRPLTGTPGAAEASVRAEMGKFSEVREGLHRLAVQGVDEAP